MQTTKKKLANGKYRATGGRENSLSSRLTHDVKGLHSCPFQNTCILDYTVAYFYSIKNLGILHYDINSKLALQVYGGRYWGTPLC
jgi:hypothetical protein